MCLYGRPYQVTDGRSNLSLQVNFLDQSVMIFPALHTLNRQTELSGTCINNVIGNLLFQPILFPMKHPLFYEMLLWNSQSSLCLSYPPFESLYMPSDFPFPCFGQNKRDSKIQGIPCNAIFKMKYARLLAMKSPSISANPCNELVFISVIPLRSQQV